MINYYYYSYIYIFTCPLAFYYSSFIPLSYNNIFY